MGKNRLYNFFSGTDKKKDKGVEKKKETFKGVYDIEHFFKFLKRNFANITKMNFLFILFNLPIISFLLGLSGNFNLEAQTPQNMVYPLVYGAMQYDTGPSVMNFFGIHGINTSIAIITTPTKILLSSIVLLVFTFGISNVGVSHIARSIVRRQHVFAWSDFKEAIKKNFKQGFIMGIIDFLLCALIAYDLVAYYANMGSYITQVSFYIMIFITLFWLIARFYIYLIMITFDLSFKKILGNSFRFVLLGIKRNLCAVLALILLALLSVYIYIYLPTVGVLLPFMFTMGLGIYTAAYCSYPVIHKYMIEPYYKVETNDEGESVFVDRG